MLRCITLIVLARILQLVEHASMEEHVFVTQEYVVAQLDSVEIDANAIIMQELAMETMLFGTALVAHVLQDSTLLPLEPMPMALSIKFNLVPRILND